MKKCHKFARCQMTATFTPECLCPLCEENYQPVCSSTGLTHASECQLHRMSCLNNGDDVVIEYKPCGELKFEVFLSGDKQKPTLTTCL